MCNKKLMTFLESSIQLSTMSFYKGDIHGLQARCIENKTARAILYNYHSQETESFKIVITSSQI